MEEKPIYAMSDADLLDMLDELEERSKRDVVDAGVVLDKVTDIERRLAHRRKIDKKIKEKLDSIKELL